MYLRSHYAVDLKLFEIISITHIEQPEFYEPFNDDSCTERLEELQMSPNPKISKISEDIIKELNSM